jgi:hypothetical protein
MKRLLLLVVAVLVPFGALIAWGLSSLDAGAPTPPPAPLPNVPPTAVAATGDNAREGVARALQPNTAPTAPAALAAPASAAPALPNSETPLAMRGLAPPPAPGPIGTLPSSGLEQQTAAFVARPRPGNALGNDQGTLVGPPPRTARTPQVMESPNKNGFPPLARAAARQLTAHCWSDSQGRAPAGAQVIVLAQPMPDGRWHQTRVSWSSWSDPMFMACVEDAIHEGSFPTGDVLPGAPVLETLEFGAPAPK